MSNEGEGWGMTPEEIARLHAKDGDWHNLVRLINAAICARESRTVMGWRTKVEEARCDEREEIAKMVENWDSWDEPMVIHIAMAIRERGE
jgi:hypothetical protein